MFKSLFFALFWHLWLCWRASYFISDHLLLKNLLRTLKCVPVKAETFPKATLFGSKGDKGYLPWAYISSSLRGVCIQIEIWLHCLSATSENNIILRTIYYSKTGRLLYVYHTCTLMEFLLVSWIYKPHWWFWGDSIATCWGPAFYQNQSKPSNWIELQWKAVNTSTLSSLNEASLSLPWSSTDDACWSRLAKHNTIKGNQ